MSKISVLKQNAKRFVDTLHVEGLHYGSVNSFNDSTSVGDFTTARSDLKTSISGLKASGNTALYDSIIASVRHLAKAHYGAKRHGIPMLLLTFTDGKENRSKGTITDIHKALERYNFLPANNCFLGIAGVGEAKKSELRSICRPVSGSEGSFKYGKPFYSNDLKAVFDFFLSIVFLAVQQTGSMRIDLRTKDVNLQHVAAFKRIFGRITALDYSLNLDRSGSMK